LILYDLYLSLSLSPSLSKKELTSVIKNEITKNRGGKGKGLIN